MVDQAKGIEKKELDDLWVRAAVVGGLWASVEIIIGSFLHNARVWIHPQSSPPLTPGSRAEELGPAV